MKKKGSAANARLLDAKVNAAIPRHMILFTNGFMERARIRVAAIAVKQFGGNGLKEGNASTVGQGERGEMRRGRILGTA